MRQPQSKYWHRPFWGALLACLAPWIFFSQQLTLKFNFLGMQHKILQFQYLYFKKKVGRFFYGWSVGATGCRPSYVNGCLRRWLYIYIYTEPGIRYHLTTDQQHLKGIICLLCAPHFINWCIVAYGPIHPGRGILSVQEVLLYRLGLDFLDIQYGLMCCYVFTLWSSCVYTPRSLPILNITYYTNWVKTSWTYSML